MGLRSAHSKLCPLGGSSSAALADLVTLRRTGTRKAVPSMGHPVACAVKMFLQALTVKNDDCTLMDLQGTTGNEAGKGSIHRFPRRTNELCQFGLAEIVRNDLFTVREELAKPLGEVQNNAG